MDGIEIELKLTMEPAAMRKLRRLAWLRALRTGEPETLLQRSVYFDTPDFRLRREGVGLRMRSMGRRRVQTLKTAGESVAGLFSRREWEWPASAEQLDFEPILATQLGPLFADGTLAAALRPVFATEIRRSRSQVEFEGCRVTVDLDEGAVAAGDRRAPICEAELELAAGEPAALFRLARRVLDSVPFRLACVDKAQQGYALLLGERARPVKWRGLALSPTLTAAEAFRRIGRACLGQLLENERCLLASGDPEALHQMRVALRRLRSAARAFRPLFERSAAGTVEDEMRWLLDALGRARDLQVFVAEIVDPVLAAMPGDDALEALRRDFADRRDAAVGEAAAAVRSGRFAALVLSLGAWVEGEGWVAAGSGPGPLGMPVPAFAAEVLAARERKLRKAGGDIAAMPEAERHRLRIMAKKLRYVAEFFLPLHPGKRARRAVAALADLQERLGRLNDLAVARRMLSAAAEGGDPARAWAAGMVVGWHERSARRRIARAEKAWRRHRARPRHWAA